MNKYPKIGIRPTIDGRQGGVRESLEEKTMNLARSVAKLITENLRNGDGSPVECVIADSTIGRVGESAACAEKFEREGRLPHDLKVAKAEIIEWEHTVDGDGGLEEAPEIWPVEKFARALREHYDDFNDFMRRNIAEYEALAAQLPEAYAHPLGQ